MSKPMSIDELRSLSVLEGLTDDQLAQLVVGGTEIRAEPGTELFREGEHADFWWVLLHGAIDLVRHVGREDAVVGHMDVPGRWAGGFRAWDAHGVYLATGRARTEARVLRRVLGDRAVVTSTKGVTGHMFGAAGAVEAVLTLLALEKGRIPPTANHTTRTTATPRAREPPISKRRRPPGVNQSPAPVGE